MLMIIKELSDMPEIRMSPQVIEMKQVSFPPRGSCEKKGSNFEGRSAEVIENTCKKMSAFGSEQILLKTN